MLVLPWRVRVEASAEPEHGHQCSRRVYPVGIPWDEDLRLPAILHEDRLRAVSEAGRFVDQGVGPCRQGHRKSAEPHFGLVATVAVEPGDYLPFPGLDAQQGRRGARATVAADEGEQLRSVLFGEGNVNAEALGLCRPLMVLVVGPGDGDRRVRVQ